MPPLVSVVIPCYAQAHFLADAIESALAQTYRPREILVVDDGSPDDVPAVTRAYPDVRLIRQENRGLSRARNRGLAECHGDYVVFLDSDDRLLPNALRSGVEALSERPGCAFVWGFLRFIDAAGRPLPDVVCPGFTSEARYDQLLRANIIGPPVVVMFRRTVLQAVNGFDPGQPFSEDYEMYLRLVRSHEAWCHRQIVAEYRIHRANMSNNHAGMLVGNLRALDQQERWVGSDPALRRALREGRRNAWVDQDGSGRLVELSGHLRARRWLRAVRSGILLLYKYPRLFLPVLFRRAKLTVLPRRA